MKKLLALVLALSLPFTGATALAQGAADGLTPVDLEPIDLPPIDLAPVETAPVETAPGEATPGEAAAQVPRNFDRLTVGSTTAMSGNFFSDMFGDNTADIDARGLLHGYNLMEWQAGTGSYGINRSVVSGLNVADDLEGNRTYTLAIYTDLAYSDGTPITAKDYAFSMLLSIDPAMRAIGAQTVESDYIVGIDAYKAGATNVLTGMRVLSDYMMSITVKAEYRPFFYELALLDYNPYPIHVIAPGCEVIDNGVGVMIQNAGGALSTAGQRIFNADLLRQTILDPETGYMSHPSVVSGPYVLDSYDAQEKTAVFSINPRFKGNSLGARPLIPQIVFKHVTPEHAIEAMRTGEIDLLNKCVSAETIAAGMELSGEGGYRTANYARSGYSFISFCCERPTVAETAVRQAIAHCLDKEALVSGYVGNYGLSVDGYYGIGQWVYQLANGTMEPPLLEPDEDATPEQRAAYEQETAAWAAVNLDGLTRYAFEPDEANRLLNEAGWTRTADGGAYSGAAGSVRCKEIGGALVPLELTLVYPEGNEIGGLLEQTLAANLAGVGVRLTVTAKPMADLLDLYYRNVPRDCDMIYLATNFATVFDPSMTFSPEDAYQGSFNRTGIVDEPLYQLAVDMRRTEPGDVLSYCTKWVAFQNRFTQVLPAIPVYSNVYFDFYRDTLQNYQIASGMSWSTAMVGAYLGEPVVQETVDEGTGLVIL